MKASIKNLQGEQRKLVDKLSLISSALKPLQNLYFLDEPKDDTPQFVIETINLLKNEHSVLKAQINGYYNAIESFQNVCEHKKQDGSDSMEYYGHDSHKSYYRCSICGYEDRY
jgi:hypothetical protein